MQDIIDRSLDSFGLDKEGPLLIEKDENVKVDDVLCPIDKNKQFNERLNTYL